MIPWVASGARDLPLGTWLIGVCRSQLYREDKEALAGTCWPVMGFNRGRHKIRCLSIGSSLAQQKRATYPILLVFGPLFIRPRRGSGNRSNSFLFQAEPTWIPVCPEGRAMQVLSWNFLVFECCVGPCSVRVTHFVE